MYKNLPESECSVCTSNRSEEFYRHEYDGDVRGRRCLNCGYEVSEKKGRLNTQNGSIRVWATNHTRPSF